MELNKKNIEELWDFWIGSKMIVGKSLTRPTNLLGSVKRHKKMFLEAADEWMKDSNENDNHQIMADVRNKLGPMQTVLDFVDTGKRKVPDEMWNKVVKGAQKGIDYIKEMKA